MKWTAKQDAKLSDLLKAKYSASEIAVRMGTTKGAVIGRSHRLRRTVFACEVARKQRIAEQAAARIRQIKARYAQAVKVLEDSLSAGASRRQAIEHARAAGGSLETIGAALGVTRERVRQIAIGL